METDRECRNRLIDCINRYLTDSITSFQFDDELDAISASTHDSTVRLIASDLWNFYDDCKDHSVVLDKKSWDYIQRLLLVLESENEMHRLPLRGDTALMPFSSISHLLSVYRACAFRKRRFRPELCRRRIRTTPSDVIIAAWKYLAHVIYVAVALCWRVPLSLWRRLRVVMQGGNRQ